MVNAMNQGHVRALMLLDMSAAFDTVDHSILINILQQRFSVDNSANAWLSAFLSGQQQIVHINNSDTSSACVLPCRVPQRLVPSPKLFLTYAKDITEVLGRRLLYHM
jgi:Reverse transcriptase (RNA-dependent DNA polymerase)